MKGHEITGWNLLYAPKGSPSEAVRTLATELARIMGLVETQDKLLQLGIEPKVLTGDALAAFTVAERDKWGAVIRSANIRVE